MGQNICLNDLSDANLCCNFFYESMFNGDCRSRAILSVFIYVPVVLRLQDIEDLVEQSTGYATMQSVNDANTANKLIKDVNEALLFICEFVHNCVEEEASSGIYNINFH